MRGMRPAFPSPSVARFLVSLFHWGHFMCDEDQGCWLSEGSAVMDATSGGPSRRQNKRYQIGVPLRWYVGC